MRLESQGLKEEAPEVMDIKITDWYSSGSLGLNSLNRVVLEPHHHIAWKPPPDQWEGSHSGVQGQPTLDGSEEHTQH